MWDLSPEERREADQKRLEEIRALPPDQQLAVEIDLRELAEVGYYEDELLLAYEEFPVLRMGEGIGNPPESL